ncbi:MAG: hypothetical protein IJ071_11260 [Ruminococcus sp.]|nr:hypothetical protein [Ruminococcus sp.]
MKIIEIIKDIFDDVDATDQRYEDSLKDSGRYVPSYRRRRGSPGIWLLFLPQILGFVLGLAIAKMIGGGYLVFGVLAAFGVGTYKSVSFDKITLKYALLRNAIILVMITLFFGAVILLSSAD